MSLKELIARDNTTVFFDTAEFAEAITIDGVETVVVEDGDQLMQYRAAGLCEGERLYYAPHSVFSRLPRVGDALTVGQQGKKSVWRVERCSDADGIVELVLRAGR